MTNMKNEFDLTKLQEVSSIIMFIYLLVLTKETHDNNNNE
jgi:hypothetical protein